MKNTNQVVSGRSQRTRISWARMLQTPIFIVCASVVALASTNQVEIQWSELGPMITGQRVKLVLPDGAQIQGQTVAVREDALVVNISKTSDRKSYPKGQNVVRRASVSTVQLETSRSSGRTVGVIVGSLGGLILGGDLVAHTAHSEASAIPAFFGISTGSAILGYYLGREHDRQVTIIKIAPNQ